MLLAGCHNVVAQKDDKSKEPDKVQTTAKKIEVAKNISLEIDGDVRRVIVNAVVCMRRGMLEQFLCRKMTKEHESIVAADVDAREIHKALLVAVAEPGAPVQFRPKYQPAHGTVIKVFIQYEEKDKTIKVPAQQWVRQIKSGKELEHDWVFGGSILAAHPFDPKAPPVYAANDGDVICLANFESAMLDLPLSSSMANDDLLFEAFTERIPPEDTRVVVILEPVAKKK